MLANADVVRAVARTLEALPSPPPLVIDPVCVSTSGHTLLEHDSLGALITELLPLATVLTPNASEAALLLQYHQQHQVHRAAGVAYLDAPGWGINSIEDMLRASRALCALGPQAVLLKGGHVGRGDMRLADVKAVADAVNTTATASGELRVRVDSMECDGLVPRGANMEILLRAAQDPAMRRDDVLDVPVIVDVLCEVDGGGRGSGGRHGGARCTLFVRPYLDSTSTHGTGCTLSAALACALARGRPRTRFGSPPLLPETFSLISLRHMHAVVNEAVAFAGMYTHHGIATAFSVGSGHGPLNHMHPILTRVLQRRV
jgi:hydroxymethylpyrimidine/phosphomethylpyrimidine kinase